MAIHKIKFFTGRSSRYLAEKIVAAYGTTLGDCECLTFSDGEFQPRYAESIRGCTVFIIQSTFPNADNLMELLLMIDAAKQGKSLELAIDSGIDIKPYVYDLMNSSFEDHDHLCRYLMRDSEYVEKTLELFRHELPLEEMKTQPTKTHGLGSEYRRQRSLEFLLQELRPYCFEGQDFVTVGLQSAPVRTRNFSLLVLEAWVYEKQKPLSELLPDMYELLSKLIEIEPDDKLRSRMEKLLAGAVSFTIKTGEKAPVLYSQRDESPLQGSEV